MQSTRGGVSSLEEAGAGWDARGDAEHSQVCLGTLVTGRGPCLRPQESLCPKTATQTRFQAPQRAGKVCREAAWGGLTNISSSFGTKCKAERGDKFLWGAHRALNSPL